MFKIGEFSQMGQVSGRMLRHYDKLGLLKPEMIDRFTGYRYYTLNQLPRLNRIIALKELGFSLEQITDLLDEDISVEQMRGMLLLKQKEIEQTLAEEQRRLARVAARLRHIENAGEPMAYDVILKKPDVHTVVCMRDVVPDIAEMEKYRCSMLDTVFGWLQAYGVESDAPEMFIYHNVEFQDTDLDMELAVPIPAEVGEELANRTPQDVYIRPLNMGDTVATTLHKGNVYDLTLAIIALTAWIHENDYQAAGAVHEIHLSGREGGEEIDYENVVFEFQTPVIPA